MKMDMIASLKHTYTPQCTVDIANTKLNKFEPCYTQFRVSSRHTF